MKNAASPLKNLGSSRRRNKARKFPAGLARIYFRPRAGGENRVTREREREREKLWEGEASAERKIHRRGGCDVAWKLNGNCRTMDSKYWFYSDFSNFFLFTNNKFYTNECKTTGINWRNDKDCVCHGVTVIRINFLSIFKIAFVYSIRRGKYSNFSRYLIRTRCVLNLRKKVFPRFQKTNVDSIPVNRNSKVGEAEGKEKRLPRIITWETGSAALSGGTRRYSAGQWVLIQTASPVYLALRRGINSDRCSAQIERIFPGLSADSLHICLSMYASKI